MNFPTLQTFQAAIEASVRELTTKQLALVQSFAEKQKNAMSNPAALMSPQVFAENQTLLQEFVVANQAFIASSLQATQDFWRDQTAETQAALQAAGVPSVKEAVGRMQTAVQEAVAPAKSPRAKR